ncbi:secreted RxLR effector protein 161-like [Capsicum annuum]|uniref:secreted RxLR effector protein 161-like n=1 Tax=Capsicum annuum TaxID=4072 RepID=UPI001FB0A778|nr:secreted RxLR effector protein 161-like [Capsicum annuum]
MTLGFVILDVYLDDINFVGTPEEVQMVIEYLKKEFKMKDLRKTKLCLDPFRPLEEDEEILGPEIPYLCAIGALIYLANARRLDITFFVNLIARYSSSPMRRHWNGVKHILRYLKGTIDIGLFYANKVSPDFVGHADAGYLSNPHKAQSQTGYVFTYGDTAISWRSTKQSIVATSSNHAEIISIHKKNGDIDVQQIRSSDNLADLFTKFLPIATFE